MDVFVSYSGKDIEFVIKMCGILKEHGISYWVEYENEDYAAKTADHISDAKVLLAFISKNSNESKRVINELNCASMNNKPILPVIIDDVEISPVVGYYIANSNRLSYSQSKEFTDIFVATIRSMVMSHDGLYAAVPQVVNQSSLDAYTGSGSEEKNSNKNKIIFAVVSAVLVVAAVITAVLVINSDTDEKSPSRKKRVEKDSEKVELLTDDLSDWGQQTVALEEENETFGEVIFNFDDETRTTLPEMGAITVAPETELLDDIILDFGEIVTDSWTTAPSATKASTTKSSGGNSTQTIVIPQTKAEIVAYFNKSLNNVKTNAKSVKQEYVTHYLASSATVPSVLNSVYKMLGSDEWLINMLKNNSKGTAAFTTKADIQAKFPVENQTWASKLTVDDVKSAKCEIKGKLFVITIETKPDGKSSTVDYGQGHAPKALNAVPPRIINDNIPGAAKGITGTASMAYPYGKVVIKVDILTGNVITAEYDVQWTIHFDKVGAVIPLGTRSSYVVTF